MCIKKLPVSITEDGIHFVVEKPILKTVLGVHIVVPIDFVSDGASVPRFFWRILPPIGPYILSAIIHDWLYRTGHTDKKTADKILFLLAKENKTPIWQCWLLWLGVFVGGHFTWKKYRKLSNG